MQPDKVLEREESVGNDRRLCRKYAHNGLLSLQFSQQKVIKSAHKGGVTWFDLDPIEHRYLLAVAADASIAAYDTHQPAGGPQGVEHPPLFTINKQSSPAAHKYSVTSVAWYPVDIGLFVTGAFDHKVKVWDANCLAVAASFGLTDKVNAVAMSPIASSHCLVAAAGTQPQVMLCDITTGGFTHTLAGHRASVWAVQWSLTNEHQLVTGGCDGQLLLWDVRRAGALHAFDMHHTTKQTTTARNDNGITTNDQLIEGFDGRRYAMHRPDSNIPSTSSAPDTAAGGGPQRPPTSGAAFASAHDRAISGLAPTPDGLHWLSAGTDDKIRLWDATTKRHMLVHYPDAFNRAMKSRQISVTGDSSAVFHPSGSAVQVYDIQRGTVLKVLKGGHFESINCCKWNPMLGELYTGANDNNIVVWSAQYGGSNELVFENDKDKDNWSD